MVRRSDQKYTTAVALRRQGHTYSYIGSKLGIAKSTASLWLKNILLNSKELKLVKDALKDARLKSRQQARLAIQRKMIAREIKLKSLVTTNIATIHNTKNQNMLMCALLFWCEGRKDTRYGLHFINSDSLLIQFYLKLLRSSYNLDESKFRFMMHLHSYHDRATQTKYWSGVTSIPEAQFYVPYQKQNTGIRRRAGYQGCISVRYLDTNLARQVKLTYELFANEFV